MAEKIIDIIISEIEVGSSILNEIENYESTLVKDIEYYRERVGISAKMEVWINKLTATITAHGMKLDALRILNAMKESTSENSLFSLRAEGEKIQKVVRTLIDTAEKLEVAQAKKTIDIITIDDIDAFAEIVSGVNDNDLIGKYDDSNFLEDDVENAIIEVLGESTTYKESDSGAETRDLFTNRLIIGGRRYPAAFMLKGKSVSGELMISNCGKNGDQLLKLAKNSAASVFIVQHVNKISPDVMEALRDHLNVHGAHNNIKVCFVDGLDTARILKGLNKDLEALSAKKGVGGRKSKTE